MKIKQRREDFFVREISNLSRGKGEYNYFLMRKKGRNTLDVVKEISRKLNRKVGFAGSKDRNAVTEQNISILNVKKERVENLRLRNVELKYIGSGSKPISLGDLRENEFRIIVRDLENKDYRRIKQVINYFDEQRFSEKNVEVGFALLKKDFGKVCGLLKLEFGGKDYLNAIRLLDRRLLLLYLHSVQSLIWNETVEEYLRKNYRDMFEVPYPIGRFVFVNGEVRNKKVPLVGFLCKLGDFGKIANRILEYEGLGREDFIIRELPDLILEGGKRDLVVNVKNLNVEFDDDELNKGRYKAVVKFRLPKGSYGSLVIKEMFYR